MMLATVLTSVGINLILLALLYIRLIREIEKNRRSSALLEEIRDDAEEIVREINQVTDRNIAVIEHRIGELKGKIVEADKRISLLQKHAEKESREQQTYTQLKESRPVLPSVQFDKLRKKVPESESTIQESSGGQSLRERVLDLQRKGFSQQVIAQKTGVSVGEIDLMISLSGQDRGGE